MRFQRSAQPFGVSRLHELMHFAKVSSHSAGTLKNSGFNWAVLKPLRPSTLLSVIPLYLEYLVENPVSWIVWLYDPMFSRAIIEQQGCWKSRHKQDSWAPMPCESLCLESSFMWPKLSKSAFLAEKSHPSQFDWHLGIEQEIWDLKQRGPCTLQWSWICWLPQP